MKLSYLAGLSTCGIGLLFGPGSLADDGDAALDKWRAEAEAIVTEAMEPPGEPVRFGGVTHTVELVLNSDGSVRDVQFGHLVGQYSYIVKTRGLPKRLAALPPLPASVASDGIVLRAHLIYWDSEGSRKRLLASIDRRRPHTSVTQIAGVTYPLVELTSGR